MRLPSRLTSSTHLPPSMTSRSLVCFKILMFFSDWSKKMETAAKVVSVMVEEVDISNNSAPAAMVNTKITSTMQRAARKSRRKRRKMQFHLRRGGAVQKRQKGGLSRRLFAESVCQADKQKKTK